MGGECPGTGSPATGARAPRRQRKEGNNPEYTFLPEAARPPPGSPGTREPARRAHRPPPGLCFPPPAPQPGDSPHTPQAFLRAPAWMSPRAPGVGGGVRRGARGGRARRALAGEGSALGYPAATRACSIPLLTLGAAGPDGTQAAPSSFPGLPPAPAATSTSTAHRPSRDELSRPAGPGDTRQPVPGPWHHSRSRPGRAPPASPTAHKLRCSIQKK